MQLSNEQKRLILRVATTVSAVLLLIGVTCATLLRLQSFASSGTPPSLDTNVDCSPCASSKPSYCEPLPFQYKKVVWFITDGWAYYRAKSALDTYSNNSIVYTHSPIGDRWSHAIYTSWWTGIAPMNMLGFPVKGDQLWESLARAEGRRCELTYDNINYPERESNSEGTLDYSIEYEGPVWAPIAVGGGKSRMKKAYSFDTFNEVDEVYETDPHVYPTLEISQLKTRLEEIASKNMSFIAHSGLYDKSCHMMDKDNSARKNREAEYLTDYFSDFTLKDFIDSHPDYLLILSSDHGAYEHKISEHFHGDAHTKPNGNIGYVMFYAANLPPKPQSEIDTVDVAATVCKYLEDCDIPFHSSGVAMNYYGPNATDADYLNLYKQNLAQLQKAAKFNGLDFDYDSVNKMLKQGTPEDAQTIRKMAMDLKDMLYDPALLTRQTIFAYTSLAFTTLLAFGFLGYILKTNFVNWRYSLIFFPAATIILSVIPYSRYYMQAADWLFFMWFICAGAVAVTSALAKTYQPIFIVAVDSVICGLLYQLNSLLEGTESEKPVAIISSIAFLLLGAYEFTRNKKSFYSSAYVGYGILLFLFFCTKESTELYFVFGFHVIAFLIYGSVIPCILYLTAKRKFEKSYLPLSAMLLLVRNGDFSVIVLNVLFMFVLPKFEFPLELPTNGKPYNWKQTSLSYSILIYLLHHGYWFFLASNSILNMNVNPVWGSVGLDSWNAFPTLSGGFMGYGKLGFWFVHTFFLLGLFARPSRHPEHSQAPSIFDLLGKRFHGYFQMLTESKPVSPLLASPSNYNYVRFAIAYSVVELIFTCWSEQFMLILFTPKQAWRAVACLLAIYSCQTFAWLAYETLLKPKKPHIGDESSSSEETDGEDGIPLVVMESK
mmetsp:Transcript_10987/g.15130  ORF Transcript_10987/g.15130 Transcript_10987/m.15130 type:complete len:885 (+) Transcript_10987:54-2708(+)